MLWGLVKTGGHSIEQVHFCSSIVHHICLHACLRALYKLQRLPHKFSIIQKMTNKLVYRQNEMTIQSSGSPLLFLFLLFHIIL